MRIASPDLAVTARRMCALSTLLLILFAAALTQAPAASAIGCTPLSDFPAPPPGAPLPGSCFEGYDGNQVDPDGVTPPKPAAPNRLDWGSAEVLSAAQRAKDYVQGAADSQFTQGTEENPDSWKWNVGSLGSDKYNMISGYSYQEPSSKDLMLALGFVRESNNGTSWLAFELNQKQPGYRTEPLVNAVPAQNLAVPTRSTGDLLITYSVSNNNSPKPIIGLCKWVGDEHSGKWTNMSGVPVASNCPALGSAVAQADMNGADIPENENFLGSPSGLLQKGTFGEAMVNLTEAFKAAGANPNTKDDCLSFGYFWAHSRSSEPITSAQQDFILPTDAISVANCAVEGTKWHDKDGNGLINGADEKLGGWTIYADYDNDGVKDPGEPFDVTAPKDVNDKRPLGSYSLTGLVDGTYPIREVAQAGWQCTAPAPYDTKTPAADPAAPALCASEVDMTGAVIDGVDFLNFDPDPSILLEKSAVLNSAGAPKAGEKITYTFKITNDGNVTLDGVDLDDDLLGYTNVVCNAVTVLAPGASTTCTGDYTLTQADIDAGSVHNNADACGDPPVGDEVCSPDATTTPLAPAPLISLIKTGVLNSVGAPKAGDTITYTFVIKNTGNVTLSGVDLDDDLLGYSDVTCNATTVLAPGASTTCTGGYTLTQADIDAGKVVNHASACGDSPKQVEVCAPDGTTTPLTPGPAITLDKAGVLNSVGSPKAGDTVTYTFVVKNTGTVTLDGVDLDDDLLGYTDVVCNAVTALAPGAWTTCTGDYTLTQSDIDAGSVKNNADACGDSPADVEVCDPGDSTTPLPASPSISLDKTGVLNAAGTPKAGDTVTYTFVIKNTGNVTLDGVDLDDDLLGYTNVVCNSITILGPGGSVTCTGDYTLKQSDIDAGSVKNNADACGDSPTDVEVCGPDDTTPPLAPSPSISLDKTGVLKAGTNPKAGDTITYTFEITNTGNVTLTGSDLDDALVGKADAVCGATTLAPGAKTSCTADYTLTQDDLEAGTVTNTAEACADPPAGPEVCDPGTTTTPLDPSKAIQVEKSGPATAHHGESATYTYLVSNTGNVSLAPVVVTDDRCAPVEGPVAFVKGDNDGKLEVGEQWRYSCTTTIGAHAAGETNPVVNTATATGTPPRGAPVSATDTHSTLVVHPEVHIEKTGPDSALAGSRVPFALVVTNPGDVPLTGQTLSVVDSKCDAPPLLVTKLRNGAADPTTGTLDPGDSWTYTCSVPTTVGQTSVANVATVAGEDPGKVKVTDDDDHVTALTQPQIQVLPETAVSAAARLSGPSACVSKAFTSRVTGRGIAKVVWRVDNKVVKTFTSKTNKAITVKLRVNPAQYRSGMHRLQAKVTFATATRTGARTLRMQFTRCGRQAVKPDFTG
jgi:uncharacterized repeat protein (TIGR01451 family)